MTNTSEHTLPKVLFVDDEVRILRSLSRSLSDEPLTVLTAESGEKALQILRNERVDIVVSDQRMPGMKGSELLGEVRRLYPDVCRVMLSGHADMDAALQAINEGRISKFLLKPVASQELVAAIHEVLDERRESDRMLDLSQSAGNVSSLEVLFSSEGEPRIRWSENARNMFWLDPDVPLDGLSILYDQVHPDDLQSVKSLFEACLSMDSCPVTEFRLLRSGGEVRWVSQVSDYTGLEDGRPVRLFSVFKDITEQKQQEDKLLYQAFHDPLTGLGNRAMLIKELGRRQEDDSHPGVLFIDVDNFKLINDSMGHDTGDWLLEVLAKRLRSVIDSDGLLTRFGGDEFVVISNASESGKVLSLADRIHSSLTEPLMIATNEFFVTASIGVALSEGRPWSSLELLRQADTAMYEAKRGGGASTRVFDDSLFDKASNRFQMLRDLRLSIERDEFYLVYQPVVSLKTMQLVGYESLIRWNHPERGLVMPSEFIPLAEESGQINGIGGWVMEAACRQAYEFGRFKGNVFVSFNVSVHQLRQTDLVETLTGFMEKYRLRPEQLKVEITESGLMEDVELSLRVMNAIRDLGVKLQIDDFGTGYSSMCYLQRIPAQSLKVDRSFVMDMENSNEDRAIVGTIVDLARSLGLTVVVEGVETTGQLSLLRDMGCEYAQGYIFDKPLSFDEATLRTEYNHLLEAD